MNKPMPINVLLDHRASEDGEHAFLIYNGTTTTYQEMADRTTRLAHSFAALGMTAGDRVAIMSTNRPEFLETWFASARLGAIEVPVNVALRGRFLSYMLNDSGARFLVIEAELLAHVEKILDALPHLEVVIVLGEGRLENRQSVSYDLLLEGTNASPIENTVDTKQTAVIGYTSGTTGPSKGVMLSHRAVWYAGADAANGRGLTKEDVFSTSLPLFHLNAQHLTTAAVLYAGATLALESKFSASKFWEQLADVRATHVNVIGAMLGILMHQEPSPHEWTHYPRMAFAGPLSGELIEEAARRWNLRFVTGYGATESGIVTYAGTEGLPEGSCGLPSPHFEVDIVNDDGESVAANVVGEIVTRPKRAGSMMSEYWGMPEKTIEAFRDLWYHTGDLGRRDENGYIYFVDRKKDAIRRRGENISSFELEEAIADYEGIAEVAAIGVPSELSEDEVKVYIRLAPSAIFDHTEFLAWCEEYLPRYMIPRFVEVVEDFPRTPTQRIEKYRLRQKGHSAETWDRERQSYVGNLV